MRIYAVALRFILVIIGWVAFLPTTSVAATAAIHPRAVIADLRRILLDNYVLTDMRPRLAAVLDRGLQSNRYAVSEPAELTRRVNEDLQAVAQDKHLVLRYDPERQKHLVANDAFQANVDDGPSPEEVRTSIRENHGIRRLELLSGNIRYLKYDAFDWVGDPSSRALDDAVDFLAAGDAVIVDLRDNGGGNPAAVRYLVSAFLDPGTPITTFFMGSQPAFRNEALTSGPSGRLKGKPLYVLISNETASAAEGFSGTIAGYRLGEIVGETTAGAGYRNDLFPLSQGFFASVSIGRAVLASTGKDWEKVGVQPTIRTHRNAALDVALAHARARLTRSGRP